MRFLNLLTQALRWRYYRRTYLCSSFCHSACYPQLTNFASQQHRKWHTVSIRSFSVRITFTPGMNCTKVHLQQGRYRPSQAAQSVAVSRSLAFLTLVSFRSSPMNSGYKCGSIAPVWTQQSHLVQLWSGPFVVWKWSDLSKSYIIII